jgi:hypothetical protein
MYTLPLASKQLLSNRTMTANFPVFILKPWHCMHIHSTQSRSKYERQNSNGRQTFVKESNLKKMLELVYALPFPALV